MNKKEDEYAQIIEKQLPVGFLFFVCFFIFGQGAASFISRPAVVGNSEKKKKVIE
jgi:hypothetical protein